MRRSLSVVSQVQVKAVDRNNYSYDEGQNNGFLGKKERKTQMLINIKDTENAFRPTSNSSSTFHLLARKVITFKL